jgi:(R,R)-butanediol dehydrogenase / meso-butanediol dehydrogenase / diacetyl reductase
LLAIVYRAPMRWQIDQVAEPTVADSNSVLVRVIAVGLCGSDKRRFFHAAPPQGYFKTSILGHEVVGIVEEIGSTVNTVRPGDRVVVEPLIPCGVCAVCLDGEYQLCNELRAVGRDVPGGFAERLVVPARCVRLVPESVTSEDAVLADPIAACWHAFKLSKLLNRSGRRAAVIGDGPLALLCLQILVANDVEAVLIGKHRDRIQVAQSVGGAAARIASEVPASWMSAFHVVFEAVGGAQPVTMELGIDLAVRGGEIIVLGAFDAGYCLPLQARKAFAKELAVLGSFSYSTTEGRRDIDTALDLLRRRLVTGSHFTDVVQSLTEFDKALLAIAQPGARGPIKLVMSAETRK